VVGTDANYEQQYWNELDDKYNYVFWIDEFLISIFNCCGGGTGGRNTHKPMGEYSIPHI
jgi:hypothetical protein